MISKTTPTLQVVINSMLNQSSSIHSDGLKALKSLGASYVSFVFWHHYPHTAVFELKLPTKTETFRNFSDADPFVEDFMEATEAHPVIIKLMFKTDKPVEIPVDPKKVFLRYNAGTEFRDTTLKEVADYYVRLFSWYAKGGYTDELSQFQKSERFYKIPDWEVLNEMERRLSPQLYTRIYDAIFLVLKRISSETKFVGLALGAQNKPDYFEIDTFIAGGEKGTTISGNSNWNLSGSVNTYIYLGLAELGIDVAGESQLVGYLKQLPDVTMMDWKNGKLNTRYWVLKLLKDNFGPGNKLLETRLNDLDVSVQAFITTEVKDSCLIKGIKKCNFNYQR